MLPDAGSEKFSGWFLLERIFDCPNLWRRARQYLILKNNTQLKLGVRLGYAKRGQI